MAKKSGKTRARKQTPPRKRRGAATRRSASASAKRKTGRKTASAKAPKRKAAKKAKKKSVRKAAAPRQRRTGARAKAKAPAKATAPARKATAARRGGTGRERGLAQTPKTGRSVTGPTNPMPTKRSTGTPSGAGSARHAPGLDRERRRLREVEENVPTPPSSLDLDRSPSAARSGRAGMRETRLEHNETSPVLTGGDVDADWQDAYAVGDEAPGGDNPTPDQDRVDDIGKALGVVYEDNEELKASDKITERDRHRWELDPASSEDYRDRDKDIDAEE